MTRQGKIVLIGGVALVAYLMLKSKSAAAAAAKKSTGLGSGTGGLGTDQGFEGSEWKPATPLPLPDLVRSVGMSIWDGVRAMFGAGPSSSSSSGSTGIVGAYWAGPDLLTEIEDLS